MSNEFLFIAFLLLGLCAGVVAIWRGQIWVEVLIITITLYLGITEAKIIHVFGLPTTLGTALYGVIFFLTDILGEKYGKKAAFAAIRRSIVAAIIFQILLQATRIAVPIGDSSEISSAMNQVFAFSGRIVLASLVVYAISQTLDVWLYHAIKKITSGRHLWFRNNMSTIISQAVDTWLFTFLAFYGVYDDWAKIALVGYGFKLVVALCDTAFAYIAKAIPERR